MHGVGVAWSELRSRLGRALRRAAPELCPFFLPPICDAQGYEHPMHHEMTVVKVLLAFTAFPAEHHGNKSITGNEHNKNKLLNVFA